MYIDLLRAIGIILMVLAHIPLANSFVHFVHGFHMPLFFVISGYLYYKGGYKHLFKTGKKLIVPYISFSLIGYLLWVVEIKPESFNAMLTPIKSVLWINSSGMPIAGALWFLTAMLFVNIMAYLLETYFTGNILKAVVIVTIFVIGLLETTLFPFRFPWSFGASCVGLGYFYFGVILNRCWDTKIISKLRQINILWYLAVMILVSFFIMQNGILNMRTGQYACIPITVINSLIFIFVLWMLIYRISFSIEHIADSVFIRELLKIGEYSIIYLCCNELVINVTKSVLGKIGIDNLFVITCLVFVLLKICEKIILLRPFNFMIGQTVKK